MLTKLSFAAFALTLASTAFAGEYVRTTVANEKHPHGDWVRRGTAPAVTEKRAEVREVSRVETVTAPTYVDRAAKPSVQYLQSRGR